MRKVDVKTCETCTAEYIGDFCGFCHLWRRMEKLLEVLDDAMSELDSAVNALRVELGGGMGTSLSDLVKADE